MLYRTLSEALRDPPPVPVTAHVSQDNAAKVVIDLAGSDHLLVEGSRGLVASPACCWGR